MEFSLDHVLNLTRNLSNKKRFPNCLFIRATRTFDCCNNNYQIVSCNDPNKAVCENGVKVVETEFGNWKWKWSYLSEFHLNFQLVAKSKLSFNLKLSLDFAQLGHGHFSQNKIHRIIVWGLIFLYTHKITAVFPCLGFLDHNFSCILGQ